MLVECPAGIPEEPARDPRPPGNIQKADREEEEEQ